MTEAALVDTNILISFYNHGLYEENLLQLNQESNLWLSAVTLNEFVRGAHDKISKEIAKGLLELIKEQIITPTEKNWIECAQISEKILWRKKRTKLEVLLLQNDILIALGAREAQAKLITADKQDFKIISQHVDLKIEYW